MESRPMRLDVESAVLTEAAEYRLRKEGERECELRGLEKREW